MKLRHPLTKATYELLQLFDLELTPRVLSLPKLGPIYTPGFIHFLHYNCAIAF